MALLPGNLGQGRSHRAGVLLWPSALCGSGLGRDAFGRQGKDWGIAGKPAPTGPAPSPVGAALAAMPLLGERWMSESRANRLPQDGDFRGSQSRVNMASTPAPHSATLRRGRFSEHGRVYLLTMATEGRLPVFRDFGLARAAICELGRCDALGLTETLAYVLMPDHLHWLLVCAKATFLGLPGDSSPTAPASSIGRMVFPAGACGSLAFTIMPSRARKSCAMWRDMWWPIRCAHDWWRSSGITRIGMRSGFEKSWSLPARVLRNKEVGTWSR